MSLLVMTTGGTIGAMPVEDVQNQPRIKTMPPDGRDFVREVLAEKFAHLNARCLSREPCDSLLMTEAMRRELAEIAADAPENRILITHGTDTLLTTAGVFHRTPALADKRVIFTGAMVPMTNGEDSDGYQNLAFSLEQLTKGDMPAGIFIALSDFDDPQAKKGLWKPRLYAFEFGKYEKFQDPDDRYSRIDASSTY